MIKKTGRFVSVMLFMVVFTFPASVLAHKIKIFAVSEGDIIKGYVYYPGGGRAQDSEVLVYDHRQKRLGLITTDSNGSFVFRPEEKTDHHFVIATTDGHRAEFIVFQNSLPSKLPVSGSSKEIMPGKVVEMQNAGSELDSENSEYHRHDVLADPAAFEDMMNKAIARAVRPLQGQIEQYEQKVRFHDILGGIGYIFGLAGLASFFQGRKKRLKDKEAGPK